MFSVHENILSLSVSGEAGCPNDWVFFADYGRYCGTANQAAPTATTITPFLFTFMTDGSEEAADEVNNAGHRGFRLDYTQSAC